MRTNFKSALIKSIAVLGVSFAALNSAHAVLQHNVPVTASNVTVFGYLVIGQRISTNCNISANGVAMAVSPVLNAFICQLKLMGQTNLGTMTIDTVRPGFVGGYSYTSPAGTQPSQVPNMVRGIYVFYSELPADHKETFIGLTFSSSGPAASSGVLMNSPDQAVVAATSISLNKTVALTYWSGRMPVFYLDPSCGGAGDFSGSFSSNQLSTITMN